jgi:hypothetical protein
MQFLADQPATGPRAARVSGMSILLPAMANSLLISLTPAEALAVNPDRVQRLPSIDCNLADQLKVYRATRRATETVFNGALRDYFADAKDTMLITRRLDRNDRATAVGRHPDAVVGRSESRVAVAGPQARPQTVPDGSARDISQTTTR